WLSGPLAWQGPLPWSCHRPASRSACHPASHRAKPERPRGRLSFAGKRYPRLGLGVWWSSSWLLSSSLGPVISSRTTPHPWSSTKARAIGDDQGGRVGLFLQFFQALLLGLGENVLMGHCLLILLRALTSFSTFASAADRYKLGS